MRNYFIVELRYGISKTESEWKEIVKVKGIDPTVVIQRELSKFYGEKNIRVKRLKKPRKF